MTPPTSTPGAGEKRKEKRDKSAGASSSPNLDLSSKSPRVRLRSNSLGSKLSQQQAQQEQNCTPTIPTKTQLAKCPCLKSNEKHWKIKCSNCKQVWHTACCNLVAKSLTEKILDELEKDWSCPWCFVAPFLRPLNHPSTKNESKLFGTVVAGVISDTVADCVDECLTTKTESIKLSLEKCVTEAIDAHVQKFDSEMKELKKSIEEGVAKSQHSSNSSPSSSRSHVLNEGIFQTTSNPTNPTNHIEDYVEKFLNGEEAKEAEEMLSRLQFSKVKGREVASFGENYSYTGAPDANTKEIPPCLSKIIEKLGEKEEYKDLKINQVIVNKYAGNTSYLPEHSDNEKSIRPQSKIVTISIGGERNVLFKEKTSVNEHKLTVSSGSLYAMTQDSQFYWTHRIEKEENISDTRYSITLRSVGANFKNATLILGDSNTKYLKFGTGKQGEKGTFGYHLPGNRVESFHIRDIDPLKCTGYQNVLLHCGINDIRNKSPGRLPSDADPMDVEAHFTLLVEKIKEIKALCPYTSIFVSPILPTKNAKLNRRVVQFNSLLFEFVSDNEYSGGVRSLDFSEFVDYNTDTLREDLGTWDSQNNCLSKKDILHLGKVGIRLLAKVVRESLLNKKTTTRSYKDTLTHDLGVS